jgi:hypothetical protein
MPLPIAPAVVPPFVRLGMRYAKADQPEQQRPADHLGCFRVLHQPPDGKYTRPDHPHVIWSMPTGPSVLDAPVLAP